MSDDVIDLSSRRPSPSGDDILLCECGGGYFNLVPIRYPNGDTGAGAVVINRDLSITGWTGSLVCVTCRRVLEQANPYGPTPEDRP